MNVGITEAIKKEDLAQVKATVQKLRDDAEKNLAEQGLSDEQLKTAKQLVENLMDVLEKTAEAGTIDGGATLKLDPQSVCFAAGAGVADGSKVEATLKQLVELLSKEYPDYAKGIKLNAETYQGVRMSSFSLPLDQIPLPSDAKEAFGKLLGKSADLVVGVGDKSVYVAAGRDPLAMLKSVLDASKKETGKKVPPFQFVANLLPIAQFIRGVAPEQDAARQNADKVIEVLKQAPGKDQISLKVRMIANGQTIRLEVQEGILRLIPALANLPPAHGDVKKE